MSIGANSLLIRDVLGPVIIDQPLGQARRQHEIVVGDGNIESAVDRELSISMVRD